MKVGKYPFFSAEFGSPTKFWANSSCPRNFLYDLGLAGQLFLVELIGRTPQEMIYTVYTNQ